MKGARYLSNGCLALVVLGLVLFAFSLPRLQFDNDLLALFPDSADYGGQSQADRMLAESMARKLFLLLGSDDHAATQAIVPQVVSALAACDCFSRVQIEVDATSSIALQRHYAQHLPALLAPEHRQMIDAGQSGEIARTALRRLLTDPGTGLAETLRVDPLGTLRIYTRTLRASLDGVQLDDQGYPTVVLDGRRFVLLQAELSGSPYGLELQALAKAALASALEPLAELPNAEVIKAGALFYTLSGSEQAQREISTVGLGSLIGICLLLLLVFRSPALLLLATVPIAMGVAVGVSTTYWIFGSVHVMALVFGASLMGVAIDYSLHFFARRQARGQGWQVQQGLQHLMAPLTLGLVTSVAGYLSFIAAGFPGFSQIAVFSGTGLIAAYATVMGVYPRLLARPPRQPLAPVLARGLQCWRDRHWRLAKLRHPGWALLVLALILAVGLSQLRTNDDIRAMQSPDPTLATMEQRFRQALGDRTALQYLLLEAPDRQVLLERLEQAGETLDELVAEGDLVGYQSLARFLPSRSRQSDNLNLWNQLLEEGTLSQLLERMRVSAPVADELQTRLAQTPELLSWENTWPLVRQLPDAPVYFTENGLHYAAVTLRGLSNPTQVAEQMTSLEFAHWVDPVERTNNLLGEYRLAASLLLLLAYGAITLLLTSRYGWRGALLTVAPPALASLSSLAILAVLGQEISVFNIMALLLVLGIGIDYTLFLRESGGKGFDTLLAIGLSTLTTVLSFGLLSLSATTAISSFGLTLLLGIVLGFALAPLALTELGPVARKPAPNNNQFLEENS